MLKLRGHLTKYYKPVCILFEDMKNRLPTNAASASLKSFVDYVENTAKTFPDPDSALTFKGDMLEILAELFFKAFENDPAIGLTQYEAVSIVDDYGVDGYGRNAAGKTCAVQVKYRHNPKDSVLYAEIARTYASGMLQLDLNLEGDDRIFVFTTANEVTPSCSKVFGRMLRVINGEQISRMIDGNVNFWECAYNEVKETLLS